MPRTSISVKSNRGVTSGNDEELPHPMALMKKFQKARVETSQLFFWGGVEEGEDIRIYIYKYINILRYNQFLEAINRNVEIYIIDL